MALETKIFCPLGCECESVVDGKVARCAWLTDVVGKHPQTGEDVKDSQGAMTWMPMLTIEQSRQTRGVAAALESHRNVVKSTGDAMIQIEQKKALGHEGE